MIARYFLFFIIICLTTSIITGCTTGIATVGLGHCGTARLWSYTVSAIELYWLLCTVYIQHTERSLGTYF